jgi:hypothetical protein
MGDLRVEKIVFESLEPKLESLSFVEVGARDAAHPKREA